MSELSVKRSHGGGAVLGYAQPSLYRTNAYRLTELPFEARPEHIVAAMRVPRPAAQASSLTLAPDELDRASGRELDVEALSLDEFFWLWPRTTTRDGKDRALDAFVRGAWLDAAELWRVQSQQRTHDGVAGHNLAVLFHMMALDLESASGRASVESRIARERDAWWGEAFRAWRALRDHDVFWRLYADRSVGRTVGDGHRAFVGSLRDNLLTAVVSINGQLAAQRYTQDGAWDRQIALIDASGYPSEDTLLARTLAVEPYSLAIRGAVAEAIGETRTDTRQGLVEASRLIDRGASWLGFLADASLLAERRQMADEIAVGAIDCLDAFGRATGRWADLLATADEALSLAQGHEARARISKHLVVFRTQYSTQVHRQRDEQVGALRARCAAIVASDASAQERLGQLIRFARTELRELFAAGAGDVQVERVAGETVARACRDLALSFRQDLDSVLLSMDALAVAESLSGDANVRRQLAEERASIESGLRTVQETELSEIEGEYSGLAEHATPEIYVGNAFRLTGLSVFATERELSRHAQKVEMAARLGAEAPAPVGHLSTETDGESIKTAVQRIQEVDRRLLDEFFWIWPLPTFAGEHGASTACPLTELELTDAVDEWKAAADLKLDHGLYAHNLAVLRHMQALDLELAQWRRGLSADECATRDRYWRQAVACWKEVFEATALWEEVAWRIKTLADPRLGRQSMVRLRRGLPTAVLSTVARLAVRAVGKDGREVQRLSELISASGFEPEAVRAGSGPLVDRLRDQLSNLAREATEQVENVAAEGQLIAQELMRHAWANLGILTKLLGDDDPIVVHTHDHLAQVAADCLLVFAEETEDWPAVLSTLKQIEFLARGPSARERIQGYVKVVSGNVLIDKATAELADLAKELEAIVVGATPAEDRLAQLRSLIDAHPPLADDPDYLEALRDLFAHWLQQFALRVNNEDGNYAIALEALRFGRTFATDPKIRQRLQEAEKAVGRNAGLESVAIRCRDVLAGPGSNVEKLRALGECAKSQLRTLTRQYGDDPEFLEAVSDNVAGAIRSASIDLCNQERQFATALEWLRFATSLARGAELRQRLAEDMGACQALVQRAESVPAPPAPGTPAQRGFWTSCTNCQMGILMMSHRDAHGRVFCSKACLEWFNGPRGFCSKCIAETTDEAAGGLSRINGVGTSFMGGSSKCPTCGSVVCRKVVTAVWLPVFPQSRFRVLYTSPTNFYSRRMK